MELYKNYTTWISKTLKTIRSTSVFLFFFLNRITENFVSPTVSTQNAVVLCAYLPRLMDFSREAYVPQDFSYWMWRYSMQLECISIKSVMYDKSMEGALK